MRRNILRNFKNVTTMSVVSFGLVAACLAVIILQFSAYKNLREINHSLRIQLSHTSDNSSVLQGHIDDLNKQLGDSRSSYTSLKQAVLNDPTHADSLGAELENCVPGSKYYIQSVNTKLNDDQKKAQCIQVVYGTFIGDYVNQYQY